jgi:general stress protein YciG
MDPERQREIASKGGKASHEVRGGYGFEPDETGEKDVI